MLPKLIRKMEPEPSEVLASAALVISDDRIYQASNFRF
jgi:hypothetical protein